MPDFKPRIVAFLCNWCSYAGADLAGTSRIKHKADVRVIRVPCSGRVDASFILKAFERGADGVLIGGCHPGDCHYVSGNLNARRRFFLMRSLLDFLGIEKERFQVTWCSAAEGRKWAEVVDEVCESVSRIGPFEPYREMTAALRGPDREIEASDE
ncbi:MAG: hydrogenase iron-sulfur subunit [Candidatus Eisenbacteria bacterium]